MYVLRETKINRGDKGKEEQKDTAQSLVHIGKQGKRNLRHRKNNDLYKSEEAKKM